MFDRPCQKKHMLVMVSGYSYSSDHGQADTERNNLITSKLLITLGNFRISKSKSKLL